MYKVMGYNTDPMIQPTRRGFPMSLKYALHLTASERQDLTRIRPGPRRARPVPVRRGPAGRGVDGRSRRGRVGRLGGQREPRAVPDRGQRVGAGEAQLLQRAQSAPPAGQARGTLRALARERVARGMASRIRYETMRRVLKKELTPWRRVQRCYPPVPPEAGFVIRREAVRDRYSRFYDARCPVICRDEHAKFLRADK